VEVAKERIVFQLNEEKEEFEELEIDESVPLQELLDTEYILAFIDSQRKIVWTWIGNNSTTKGKVIAGVESLRIRNQYVFGYKTVAEIEGEESNLVVEPTEKKEYEISPMYDGSQDEKLTKQDIILKLEKMSDLEGFERHFIIVDNQIFRYKEGIDTYFDADIKSKKLYTLQEEIEDGPYLFAEYIPRVLFSFNKIVLIELLKKEEIESIL
jgi:hypothetical protein